MKFPTSFLFEFVPYLSYNSLTSECLSPRTLFSIVTLTNLKSDDNFMVMNQIIYKFVL